LDPLLFKYGYQAFLGTVLTWGRSYYKGGYPEIDVLSTSKAGPYMVLPILVKDEYRKKKMIFGKKMGHCQP